MTLHFRDDQGNDPRRYNYPNANEVAIVFCTNADDEVPYAHIVVHEKGFNVHTLSNHPSSKLWLNIY